MCLIAKDLPKKCKKTIVVYKEIEIVKHNNISLKTPYRNTPIVSPLMIAEPVLSKEDIENIYTCIPIREGFIHSYKKHEGFIHSYKKHYETFFMNCVVVKAYIPKGAYYIEGQLGDMASTKLILDPKDVYDQTDYKFSLSDRIKFFLWRIIHLIK